MQPLPEGQWGMPDEMLRSLPGFDDSVEKRLAEARAIMQELGYGPSKPLRIKVWLLFAKKRVCMQKAI